MLQIYVYYINYIIKLQYYMYNICCGGNNAIIWCVKIRIFTIINIHVKSIVIKMFEILLEKRF